MNVTEALHLQALLGFLFTGDSEADRTAAEHAAGYLAGCAHTTLGVGPTGEQAVVRFARTFPPGWWDLPAAETADDAHAGADGEVAVGGGGS